MRISLERQRELYERHASAAGRDVNELLSRRIAALVELGRERAFEQVGVHEYGDRTYWLDVDALLVEAEAELADAIFYMSIARARLNGDLPEPDDLTTAAGAP